MGLGMDMGRMGMDMGKFRMGRRDQGGMRWAYWWLGGMKGLGKLTRDESTIEGVGAAC